MKNKYEINEDTVEILLESNTFGNKKMLIDKCDLECVSKSIKGKIRINGNNGYTYYAIASIEGVLVFIHRLITDAPNGMDVDHINHNGLDNRKSNLRVVTHAENMQNKSRKNKGVHWDKYKKRWAAQVRVNGKTAFFARFKDKNEAIFAAKEARKKLMPYTVEH